MHVTTNPRAQQTDAVGTGVLPIAEERGGTGVQERVAGEVHRCVGTIEHRRVHRPAETIRGQQVEAAVAHDRRRVDRVEDQLDPRPQPRRRRPPAHVGEAGGSHEILEVGALVPIEAQRPRDGVQDLVRDAGRVPSLETRVVLDADPGEQRDLASTQPRDTTPATRREADGFRIDPRPARGEQLADPHDTRTLRSDTHRREGPPVPVSTASSSARSPRCSMGAPAQPTQDRDAGPRR